MTYVTFEPSTLGTVEDLCTAWEAAHRLADRADARVSIWFSLDPIQYHIRGHGVPGPDGSTLLTTTD